MRHFRSLFSLACPAALVFCGVLLGIKPAAAQSFDVDYGLSLLGLHFGNASITGQFTGDHYKMRAGAKLVGIASMISRSSGAVTSSGTIEDGKILPATFASIMTDPRSTRTTRISIKDRDVTGLEIAPPLGPVPGRLPLTPASERGIIDPLSAALIVSANSKAPFGPQACDRTMPIFDGFVRYNIVMSFASLTAIHVRGYKGPAVICKVHYQPIAGYVPSRPQLRYMQKHENIRIWLAPVLGTNLSVPLHVRIATIIGTIDLMAKTFTSNFAK